MEILRKATNPVFDSPAFVVPKPQNKGLIRMVVDLRMLNKYVKGIALMMPNLESIIFSMKDANFLFSLDILSGFD